MNTATGFQVLRAVGKRGRKGASVRRSSATVRTEHEHSSRAAYAGIEMRSELPLDTFPVRCRIDCSLASRFLIAFQAGVQYGRS